VLADTLTRQLPVRLLANGIPQPAVDQFVAQGGSAQLNFTGTGDLGAQILAGVPAAARPFVERLIPAIVNAIHEALALGIGSTFWISIGAAALAAVLVTFLRESAVGAALTAQTESSSPAA
jgi:hypothetical protein